MKRFQQRAFLLHQQPYRETSVIAQLFTAEHGLLAAVCKGVRGNSKRSRQQRSTLQPFSELSVQLSGRAELKTLLGAETVGASRYLSGRTLYAGLYLNELLLRVLHPGVEQQDIFRVYADTQVLLAANTAADDVLTEHALRDFELRLLSLLGFALDFCRDGSSGAAVDAGLLYRFDVEQGFVVASGSDTDDLLCMGSQLLALDKPDFTDGEVRRLLKHITRRALAPHLGSRPLASRALYRRAD